MLKWSELEPGKTYSINRHRPCRTYTAFYDGRCYVKQISPIGTSYNYRVDRNSRIFTETSDAEDLSDDEDTLSQHEHESDKYTFIHMYGDGNEREIPEEGGPHRR